MKNLQLTVFLLQIWALLFVVDAKAGEYAFMSIGDWGGAYFGDYHYTNALDTANGMEQWGADNNAQFVLNTGDNFYYCGIQNTTDPQIIKDYTAVYAKVNIPWYNSLGNHDYGFHPEAQLSLDAILPNWIMDDRYYHRRFSINNGNTTDWMNIVVLDTNPCINDYLGNDRSKWDPCNYEFPTCGPIPGVCEFHENIVAQNCSKQLAWFQNIVRLVSPSEWLIVIGHHRADQIDNVDFQSVLDSHKVHLYLNGHVHSLEYYSIGGQAKYATTGAGCMVVEHHLNQNLNTKKTTKHHNLWWKTKTGFTGHRILGDTLTTYFLDAGLNILYQFNVSRK